MLHEETLRLANLIEDILRLAKPDAAKATLRKIEGSIIRLVSQALDSYRTQFNNRKITLETDFADGPDRLWFDPPKLLQVINNLLPKKVKN
jgi:signal transduction histidine kinase